MKKESKELKNTTQAYQKQQTSNAVSQFSQNHLVKPKITLINQVITSQSSNGKQEQRMAPILRKTQVTAQNQNMCPKEKQKPHIWREGADVKEQNQLYNRKWN